MTMLSFRVDDDEASSAQEWAMKLGIDKSELLRQALRRQLARLSAEHDVAAWDKLPLTDDELSLGSIADWGPAEDWADWADEER